MPDSVEIRFIRNYNIYAKGQLLMPDIETARLFVEHSRVAEYTKMIEPPPVLRQRRKRRKVTT